MSLITCDQFKKRLADLCVRSGSTGAFRSAQDRHILLKSAVIGLDPEAAYAEREVNAHLQSWLMNIGRTMDLDHAAFRRYLVYEGYLERDPQGTRYRVTGDRAGLFEDSVNGVDVYEVIRESRDRVEQKKRDFLRRQQSLS